MFLCSTRKTNSTCPCFRNHLKKKKIQNLRQRYKTSSSKELVGVPETPTQQDGFRTVQPHRLEPAVQYNQQVKKTREELQSMIPQIEQTIADIDKKAAINIGDNVAIYGFGKKQGDLLTARRYLQKTAKVLKSPDEEGIKAFVSGLRRNDLANLLSLGYTDAYKALKTTQIAKKVSEGEEPTEEEYLLLTGRYLLDLADSNKKRTSSYNIGNALAEMAPFLGQIYLTSPIGEAATTAATAATKKAMTKGAVDVLRKYGLTDLLKTATTAAAQSPFTGMFMQKYADNRMPQMDMDENGKIVPVQGTGETAVDAATEALGSTFSSIFSEKMGEFIKGRVSASGKGLAATLQEPGKALKSIQSLRRDLNWSGMGYEFLEEQIDGVGQALLTDDAKLNDLFDAKKQFETLATVMLAGGAMKALEIPGYFKEKGYKKDLEKATEIFEKTVDEPSRKAIEAAINTDNVEEMQQRLSSEDFSHLTPEQGKTVLDYMKAKISYNSLFEAANTKLETTEKKATVPQNNVTVAEKTPETIQSTTQEEIPVHERYYQESMAKKQPDVVEKMPVFKNKKFSIATILPNGDISNVYVRNEGDSHKTYMSPEDAQAYEDGRMTIGFWSPTSNTFMEAPQKGKEFGQRVMDIAASKVTPSGIKPQETTKNIPEQVLPFDNRTDKQHSDYIRKKFISEFTGKGVSREQAEAAVALMDARAKVANPNNPDAWYRGIEDIGGGEFQAKTPRMYQLPDGRQVMGMSDVETTNGFYSPIEKRLVDFKQDKASVNKWKEIIGKGDESVYTGVLDYLNKLKPDQVISKADINQFMRDNRIEVVEVVNGKA